MLSSVVEESGQALAFQRSRLAGTVRVSGAKNSVLRLMAASLLTNDRLVLENYPETLLDARIHLEMLASLGKSCRTEGDALIIDEAGPIATVLEWNKRSIRNTLLILGALVTRFGEGAVPLPGGCNIGTTGTDRAFDLHVMLLEKLGAEVWEKEGVLYAKAPSGGLVGADIHLPIRSTGATENAIIAGSLAKGTTRIWNPHIRPEIMDLVAMLNSMGASIKIFGQEHIEVVGQEGLRGTTHRVIPDNVEALTWLVGASITGGEVEIEEFPYDHLEIPLIFLRESGARFYKHKEALIVKGSSCFPLDISTGPYPGINSDMQPILAVYAARSNGTSTFVDLRFPGRYGYAKELGKMGLNYTIDGNLLSIRGGNELVGCTVKALDLRAGIALALGGLMADGETVVQDAWQITRGYDRFTQKLLSLGAKVSAST